MAAKKKGEEEKRIRKEEAEKERVRKEAEEKGGDAARGGTFGGRGMFEEGSRGCY